MSMPAPAGGASAPPPSSRLWEIDALRGLMLALMTVTHIPTRFSSPLGQPLGFVSAAEGFVMLSGFMAGLVYTQRQLRDGPAVMGRAFVQRALKIYLCQAALLVFLLSAVTLVGVLTRQPAITDMVSFFLEHPFIALFSGLLLVYNPPLLDILPMYVIFMLVSPLLLMHAGRRGWNAILVGAGILWLAAQFGLSETVHGWIVRLTGMRVPFQQTGAFELLAWQFLWILGLWIGSAKAAGRPVQPVPFPRWAVAVALVYAGVHLVFRHLVGQVPFPHAFDLNVLYDKWQLGPLRLLDFLALLLLAMHFGPALARRLPRVRALESLGRASLPVFCAHLVLAMLVLATFGAVDPHRAWWRDAALLGSCFGVLYVVALASAEIDRRAAAAGRPFSERRTGRSSRPRWRPERRRAALPTPPRDGPRSPGARGRSPTD